MNSHKIWVLFCLAISLCFVAESFAQNSSGTLLGIAKDPNGDAIAGAKVTVINLNTQEARVVSTNLQGDYTIPLLMPGSYRLTVDAKGFTPKSVSGIVLNVDQTVRTDITLTVGSTSESVTVNADALALDTDTASVGELISGAQIAELPLNGRDFQDLIFLSPGAVNNKEGMEAVFRVTFSGNNVSSVSIGGGRGSSDNYTVDGTTIQEIGYDTPSYNPSLDDTAEFNELSKSYSAAYGYSMNQVNVTSKSGTNSFHGTAFEFLRNNVVDATYHGFQPQTESIPLLQQNNFGYGLGGPVRIPWLYDGRNKTFFFANYEGFRQIVGGGSAPISVPLADEMKGKFDASVLGNFTSAQVGTTGQVTQCGHTYHVGDPHPLFNPFDPNGCPFPVAADGSYTIPAGNISRFGSLFMRPGLYYPAAGPNTTGPTLGVNNYVYSSKHIKNFDQQNYRVDQNIDSKDQIFFHAAITNVTQTGTSFVPLDASTESQPGRLYTATETHDFSPSLTNQIRLGFMEALNTTAPDLPITKADLSLIAFPNSFAAPGMGYPNVQLHGSPLNDGLTYNGGGTSAAVSFSDNSVWDLNESAIWNVRRHTLSFGFGGRRLHLNLSPGYAALGRLDFNGEYSGDTFADALLGASSSIALSQLGPYSNPTLNPTAHLHFTWWAPYAQDDWKVNDRLTLNLGLRYEFAATPLEEQNNFIWPDFSAPQGAIYIANAKIAQNFGGVNPFGGGGMYVLAPNGKRGPGPAPKDVFAPRLGFAYRVFGDDKTVVRGGFGKYFDTIEANEYQASSVGIYPNVAAVGNGVDKPQTYPPAYDTNNLPSGSVTAPLLSATLGTQFGGQIQSDHAQTPYFLAWNFGVERELPWATKLELDYVANHGSKLYGRTDPNQPVQCIAINGCTVTANTPATVAVADRVPYQNLPLMIYADYNGFSNYNALDAKVEHRAADLDLVVAYTWSKALDTKSSVGGLLNDDAGWAGPQDGHNISSEYGRGNFDVGQRLALTAVYPLPIGRGKALLSNASRLTDEVVGGWNIGLLSSFQGGLPFTIVATDIQGANETFAERANHNPPSGSFKKSLQAWFDSDATPGSTAHEYTQPAPGYFGNSARDAVRAPGMITADLSLSKRFAIVEKAAFEFRFDAFNAFNHWNPDQPTNDAVFGALPGYIAPTDTQNSARILQLSGRFSF